MPRPPRPFGPARIIGAVVLAALVVAMIVSTKFLTPTQLAAALPKQFDPQQSAGELWTKAQGELLARAQPLGEVLTAIQADPQGAADKYQAISPADNTYVYVVKADATVTDADADSLTLSVPGAPQKTPIVVPLTTAINGTVIRDATGFKFADAPGQTDFQRVGDELKTLMQDEVKKDASDPASLKGKKVEVTGAINVLLSSAGGAPPVPKPVNIQPITIKAGA